MLRLTLFGENGSHATIAVLETWKERNTAFGLIHNPLSCKVLSLLLMLPSQPSCCLQNKDFNIL